MDRISCMQGRSKWRVLNARVQFWSHMDSKPTFSEYFRDMYTHYNEEKTDDCLIVLGEVAK